MYKRYNYVQSRLYRYAGESRGRSIQPDRSEAGERCKDSSGRPKWNTGETTLDIDYNLVGRIEKKEKSLHVGVISDAATRPFVQRRSKEMDSSVIGDRVNATSAQSDLFLLNQTATLFFAVDRSTNGIVLRPTAVPQTRCCKLTEADYTIMGCISVTLFVLGVATIKFIG